MNVHEITRIMEFVEAHGHSVTWDDVNGFSIVVCRPDGACVRSFTCQDFECIRKELGYAHTPQQQRN
jgi:hypothetical protein